MLTKQDIDKLAELARLGLSDEEKAGLERDLSSILGYVSELEKAQVTFSDQLIDPNLTINTMRDDGDAHAPGLYTDALLANTPKRQGQYLSVKPILDTK